MERTRSNPDSNVTLAQLLQVINKLLDKGTLYVMSKSRSSFTSKPWITNAIANSIKSKNKIYKKICKEKALNEGKFMESSLKLIRTILQHD